MMVLSGVDCSDGVVRGDCSDGVVGVDCSDGVVGGRL